MWCVRCNDEKFKRFFEKTVTIFSDKEARVQTPSLKM